MQVTVPSESHFPRLGYGCSASPWRLCGACGCADCISFLGSPYEANGDKDWRTTSFAICPCTLSLLHISLQQSWFVSLMCWMWSWCWIVIWKSVFFFSRKGIVIYVWLHNRIYCSWLVCREFCPHFLPVCCGSFSGGKLNSAGSSVILSAVVP